MAALIQVLELAPLFDKPALYTKTDVPFWDDDYISMQMLDAHLNPTFDGASRNLEFIEKSASWIGKVMPPERYSAILDIGCGPGLYTERYAKIGYAVTGVDISPRSIAYAQESSKKKNLPIHYICQDYLRLSLGEKYDLATMIYCDYGDFSYDMLTTDEFNGEDILVDTLSDTSGQAEKNILLDKLKKVLCELPDNERQLIDALFAQGLSEREWSAQTGIPQKTINDRKNRLLTRPCLKNKYCTNCGLVRK